MDLLEHPTILSLYKKKWPKKNRMLAYLISNVGYFNKCDLFRVLRTIKY